jgi:dTDP-glucose pyrophosphorylase
VTVPLVVLAAGMSSRFGRPKQLEPVGPSGETLLDYVVFDAGRARFGAIVLVVSRNLEGAIRGHVSRHWGHDQVRYAIQEPAANRPKPWGTAHAVLAARDAVDGPFGVCNADDFYGLRAFEALRTHLGAEPERDAAALIAYRLGDTLSPHGGVSRAVCATDDQNRLTGLVELRDVRASGGEARGLDSLGHDVPVPLDTPVSMNLWGFTPAVVALLEEGFATFLSGHRADPHAEYPLSTAVHHLVAADRLRVRVLLAGEEWMGITHPGDRAPAAARLRSLVDAGRYPSPLVPPRRGEG